MANGMWKCSKCGAPNPQVKSICYVCNANRNEQQTDPAIINYPRAQSVISTSSKAGIRYPRLDSLIKYFRINAYVCGIGGIVGAFGFITMALIYPGGIVPWLTAMVLSLIVAFVGYPANQFASECISVIVDIEFNTRMMHQAVNTNGGDRQPVA